MNVDWQRIIEILGGIIVGGILAKLPELLTLRKRAPAEVRKLNAETDKLDAETAGQVAEMVTALAQAYTGMVASLQQQLNVSESGVQILREELAAERTKSSQLLEENQTFAGHNRALIAQLSIERGIDPLNGGENANPS